MMAVRVSVPFPGDQHSIRPLPRHRREDTLNLQRCPLRQEHPVQRNSQLATGVPQDVPGRAFLWPRTTWRVLRKLVGAYEDASFASPKLPSERCNGMRRSGCLP
jgi:hypothetical protein